MELYTKIGIDPPRGVLLYGPPGQLSRFKESQESSADPQVLERQCWSRQSQTLPRHLSFEL
jgi:hypothetical protein